MEIANNLELRVNWWNNEWILASNNNRLLKIESILLLENVKIFTKASFLLKDFLGYIIFRITKR